MQNSDFTGQLLDGKYLLTKKLGEGGMGAVYLGKHATMGKMVAVKILHTDFISNEEVVHRFIREAQTAVAINHKNIIDIMDLGAMQSGEPFMVMEYLQGAGLDEIIKIEKQVDLALACAILEPTLKAIGAAHDKGVIHRDLKPENIYVNQPTDEMADIKLIDFGISKIQDTKVTKLTQEGTTLGTPAYMSPEQVRGSTDMNHLTDIYAVGIIFYEMLSGDTPFEGEQYNVLLANILTAEPRPPQSVYPDFPMAAWPVIEKAISKDASKRYQTAQEMLDAICDLCPQQERSARFAQLPMSIAKANAHKSIPPVAHQGKAASAILSDLVQQNTAIASATMMASHTNAASRADVHGATILSQVHDKTMMHVQAAKEKLPGKIAWCIEKGRYGLMESPRKLFFRIGAGVSIFMLFLFVGMCSGGGAVEIEVVGAPEKAEIYFNDALMSDNPFDAPKSEKRIPMRVDVKDRTRMRFTIVPNEDKQIRYVPGGRKAELIEPAEAVEDSAPEEKSPEKPSSEKAAAPAPSAAQPAAAKKSAPAKTTAKKKSTKKSSAKSNDSGEGAQSGSGGGQKNPFKRLGNRIRRSMD